MINIEEGKNYEIVFNADKEPVTNVITINNETAFLIKNIVKTNLTLINDFEDGKSITPFGGNWFCANDAANGGNSVAMPDPFEIVTNDNGAHGSSNYVRLTGKVTTKFQYGFILISFNLIDENTTMDLRKYSGIKFSYRGDGKSYTVQIKAKNNTDYNYYTYTITPTDKWQDIAIPFTSFKQQAWGQKKSLEDSLKAAFGFQWETIGQPISSVKLELDDLNFYSSGDEAFRRRR